MRKLTLLLLMLLLALPIIGAAAEVPDGMTVISSPEAGLSTLVDFDCTAEYVAGDGLYIKLSDDLMPYVLVSVDSSQTRVTDPGTYLNETLVPDLQDAYRANGALMSVVHGDGSINGRPTPILEFEYRNSQNFKIYLIALFDVYDDYTAYYRVRYYREEDRDATLSALTTVAKYLQPDPDYYANNGGAPEPQPVESKPGTVSKPQRPGAASSSANVSEPAISTKPELQTAGTAQGLAFQVNDVVQGGMVMGRCTVPTDFTVTSQATCDVLNQSAGNPWLLKVAAQSPDQTVSLTYMSTRDYMASGTGATQDETYNSSYFTPMLHYMNAQEYCDYVLKRLGSLKTVKVVEEDTYPGMQNLLRQREAQLKDTQNGMLGNIGLTVDDVAITMANRRYYIETESGLQCYYCVACATRGTWYSVYMPGVLVDISDSYILWDVPYVYTMLCPAYQWDKYGSAFPTFMENTTASDQFLAANQKLSNELWDIITGRGTTYANSYSEDVMRQETASGDDYDEERFTDYIFDQNDYTLSDGSHVKVSTAYDYVYEGDNGVVYYSDSAFGEPGTRLYPN